MHNSAIDTRSPVVSSMSISRPGSAFETSLASLIRLSVDLPIADTATTTSLPCRFVNAMCSATARMRSGSATDVPPNFWTMRATGTKGYRWVPVGRRRGFVPPIRGVQLSSRGGSWRRASSGRSTGRRRRRSRRPRPSPGSMSRRRPIQPRPPTYGGRKNRSGSASTSCSCTPFGAGAQIATPCAPWWLSSSGAQRLLVTDEERRRSVAESLGDLRKVAADATHLAQCSTRDDRHDGRPSPQCCTATSVDRMLDVQGFDHLVLRCIDVETTLAWYVDRLGMPPVRVDEWRAGVAPFPSVRVDEGTIIDLVPATDVDECPRPSRPPLPRRRRRRRSTRSPPTRRST